MEDENQDKKDSQAKVLKLVSIAEADQKEFLKALEDWVADAKAGRLSCLVIAGRVDGEYVQTFLGPEEEANWALDTAKHRIMHEEVFDVESDDDEDEEDPEE